MRSLRTEMTQMAVRDVESPAKIADRVFDTSTPVLILGGKENSLSLIRHLGRFGIAVRASGPVDCWAMYSRYCKERFFVPRGRSTGDHWYELLLGANADERLQGHIIFPCSDAAIEFIAQHQSELARRYILDGAGASQRLDLLDKRKTLELASKAGIDAPKFMTVTSQTDIDGLRENVTLPVIIKPIHTHRFAAIFGRKLFIIERDFDELAEKVRLVQSHGLDFMIVDMIPGPDSLLSSYYTYVDEDGRSLFHFTKKVIRRYPVNCGGGTYHATEWLPETAAAGQKFFANTGFRGFGNIEFKRDTRDGKLKIIEVNARFTAAHELAIRAGAPMDLIVYCSLTGQRLHGFASFNGFKENMRFWYPIKDFLAFLQLHRRGELGFWGWIGSVRPFIHVSPLHDLRDPVPSLGAAIAIAAKMLKGRR